MALTQLQLEEAWGRPASEIDAELKRFSESARLLSAEHPRLIEEHPQQWVGVHNGAVKAAGKTLKSVLSQLKRKGCPNEETIVRFISRDEVTLIL